MAKTLKPDICVIGAGSAGLSVAAAAASFGVSVVLIEKGEMGGECLNRGCVPSKALIAAARHAYEMSNGAPFGIADAVPDVNFARVMRHVHEVIASIAPNDSAERFSAMGVHVIREEARFVDPRTVVAGVTAIRARRFVIATGSVPLVPPIPGIDEVPYLTNETVFERTRLPAHLVVIGGGTVGLELAQAYRRLGSRVTVVEAAAALGKEDPELTAVALERLRREGVVIREHTQIMRIERRGRAGVRLHLKSAGGEETLDGTHLLVATARAPNFESLDLVKAGIAHDGAGIKVDRRLRTSNRRVYAIGDVAGGQFTHAANYHAGLVLRAILFRLPARENRHIVPRVTFTDPEIAHVGLTEEEARRAHRRLRILRWPFCENDRAQAERRTEGLLKMVTDARGRVLGVSIVGANAGEMINMWALAVAKKMHVRDVSTYVAPYPIMGEIGKRAAMTYFLEATRKPSVRRLIRFLRIFG